MSDVLVLVMTAPSPKVAEAIVTTLVGEHLIACGNVTLPATSIYRWQGETERASEVLVIMKTTAAAANAVTSRIAELHPYDVPEILSLPVHSGYQPYIDWVGESVAIKADTNE